MYCNVMMYCNEDVLLTGQDINKGLYLEYPKKKTCETNG